MSLNFVDTHKHAVIDCGRYGRVVVSYTNIRTLFGTIDSSHIMATELTEAEAQYLANQSSGPVLTPVCMS